jgi:cytochrome b561
MPAKSKRHSLPARRYGGPVPTIPTESLKPACPAAAEGVCAIEGGPMPQEPRAAYATIQKSLHWAMAVIILPLAAVGFAMANILQHDALRNVFYEAHKSAGLAVLALAVLRLGVRLRRGLPPPVPGLSRWQRAAARGAHEALYVLILAVPLAGWLATSMCCAPVLFLGSLPAGLPVSGDEPAVDAAFLLHAGLAFALVGIVALHVGAALHHHFVRRDETLRRMLPGTAAPAADPSPGDAPSAAHS